MRWPCRGIPQGSRAQWLLCAALGILQTVSGIGTSHTARPDKEKEAGAPRPLRGLSPKGAYQLGAAPALGHSVAEKISLIEKQAFSAIPTPSPFPILFFSLKFSKWCFSLPFFSILWAAHKKPKRDRAYVYGCDNGGKGVRDGHTGAPRL